MDHGHITIAKRIFHKQPPCRNSRYKIPRATFMARLKTFWTNCIIVRALYEQFNPGQKLEFVGFDQKPLWYNSIMAEKTCALSGQAKVGCAENVSASRARYTVMTQCRSWCESAAPRIGILFQVWEAACSLENMLAGIRHKTDTLLQGAPRGCYMLKNVLEFALGRGTRR